MKWTPVKLDQNSLDKIDRMMGGAGYVRVVPSYLEHNHAEKLSHWLSDEFLLYRGTIFVDDYIAFDLTRRGDGGQVLPMSMCREVDSDNYDRRYSSYYLTGKNLKIVVAVMEIIEESR